MSEPTPNRVLLVDDPEGAARTTANLVASLTARLASLHLISGSTAVASLVAGFAAAGREVSRTAEGDRLRRALEAGRASTNGETLWSTLRLGEWASAAAPSPVLDHVRNDLALLLAEDLEATLELTPVPVMPAGTRAEPDDAPVTFLDFLLGLWVYAREIVRAVEAMAAPTIGPAGSVVPLARSGSEAKGPLLR